MEYFPTTPAEFISQFPLLAPGDKMTVPDTNGIWDCSNGDVSLVNTNGGFTIEGQGGTSEDSVIQCKWDIVGSLTTTRPKVTMTGVKWDCNANTPGSNTETAYFYFANMDFSMSDCPIDGPGLAAGQLFAGVNTQSGSIHTRGYYEKSLIRRGNNEDMMVTRGASNITLDWMIFEDRALGGSDQYFSPHDLGSIVAYNTICRETDGLPKDGASLASGPSAWIELYNCLIYGQASVPVAENVTLMIGDSEATGFDTGLTKRSARYLNCHIIGGGNSTYGIRVLTDGKDVTIMGNLIENIDATGASTGIFINSTVSDALMIISNNRLRKCRKGIQTQAGAAATIDVYDNDGSDTVPTWIDDNAAGSATWRGGKNFRSSTTDVALRGDIIDTAIELDANNRPIEDGNAWRQGISPVGWMMPFDAVGFQSEGITPGDKVRSGVRRETRSPYRSIGLFEPAATAATVETVTAQLFCITETGPAEGVECEAVLVDHPAGFGYGTLGTTYTGTSNAQGLFDFPAFVGGTYKITAGGNPEIATIPDNASDPYQVANMMVSVNPC